MSEEKLYAVKNDKGVWLSLDSSHESVWYTNNPTFFKDRICAEDQIIGRKAHVVTLIEEPKKVVISKEQAEIVDYARGFYLPASFISSKSDDEEDEELLMKAYVNGYTVAKEKKYNVKVPHTKDVWYYKSWNADLRTTSDKKLRGKFTEAEIEHYGLQDCEKEEVTDDAD